jgi:hypothetical protein
MTGRKLITSLSLLSALLLCAVAAHSASAITTKANATAFLCVSSGGGSSKDFKDAHCDEQVTAGTGSFEHKEIAVGTETKIGGSNDKVTEATSKSEPTVFKGTLAGSKITVTCLKVKIDPTKSFVLNKTEGEAHRLTGTVRLEDTECTVTEVVKCTVKTPIIWEATFEALQGHTGPKAETNAMGLQFKGEGAEETFANITLEGAECALKGFVFSIKGSMVATSGPTTESKQDNKWGGATWVFTPKFEMQKLTIGGKTAEFSTILTPTTTDATPIPVAWTTCTKAPGKGEKGQC